MAENAERSKLGLRLVKTNWFLYSVEFSEENWKLTPNGYEAKKIHRDANNVVTWEEDYYYSGKKFLFSPEKKNTTEEFITIHYDYTTSSLNISYVGLDPSITAMFGGHGPIETISNNISVADEILKKWGISRL